MRIVWKLSDLHACGPVRGIATATEMNRTTRHEMICKQVVFGSDLQMADVLVLQRATEQGDLELMQYAQKLGIKVVYEIDDDVFQMPKGFIKPFQYYARPEVRNSIMRMMEGADAVLTTTVVLAKSLKKYNQGKPTFVVDNYLDCDLWEINHANRMTADKDHITIGWMASGSHQIDVPLIADALERLMKEHKDLRLSFIGWVGFEQIGAWAKQFADRITVNAWLDISEMKKAMEDFDIGLAPLVDNPFNRAKSSIKLLQYAALGVPCVASPLPPYSKITDGTNGFLVEKDWYACLKKLVTDEKLRNKVGATARQELLTKWDMRRNINNWTDTFQKIKHIGE